MGNLAWKLNRLRAMGWPEIVHRLRDAARQRLRASGHGLVTRPPAPVLAAGNFGQPWLAPLPPALDGAPCLAAADAILAGRFDVFALRGAALGFPPDWNRDPKTGTVVPLTFGKGIDYRDQAVVGDIKCLWEPNRHLALSDLAMAYRLSGERRYADGVRFLLDSWWDQCPYPLGPNWSSALELGLRLVSWSLTWQLLGGASSPLFEGQDGQAFLRRWLDSIYQHCHGIAGDLSRHSSANNHLFGELTGLHVAALTWPCWPDSAAWLAQSGAELEAEALRQNTAEGVNREQAIYYQHAVADHMLLCLLAGRANGRPRSPAFALRLEKMLEFIAALMDAGGAVPAIGDADDALQAHWGRAPGWNPYRSLLASGAVLFNRPDFKAKSALFDEKSRWLLGETGARAYAALAADVTRPGLPRAFPDGGYYILGEALDTPAELRLVADAGPLGYLSIAAHGHADALALNLSIGGAAVLVDPGTYAYHTQKQWRDYFRGTSAHNTLRVDGLDQSEPGGNFLWLRKANARCERWECDAEGQHWTASHDGYLRLADPLLHRRAIVLAPGAASLVVDDVLECGGRHRIELFWHFSPDCEVVLDGALAQVRGRGFSLELEMPGSPWRPALVRGREAPPLGWFSPRFDEKQAAPTLVWCGDIDGASSLRTVFRFTFGQA